MINKKPSNYGDILIQIILAKSSMGPKFRKFILSYHESLSSTDTMENICAMYGGIIEDCLWDSGNDAKELKKWNGFERQLGKMQNIASQYPAHNLDELYQIICVDELQELSQLELYNHYNNQYEPFWITNPQWLLRNEKYVNLIVDKYFQTTTTDWIYTMLARDFILLILNTIQSIIEDCSSRILKTEQSTESVSKYNWVQDNMTICGNGVTVEIQCCSANIRMAPIEPSVSIKIEDENNNEIGRWQFINTLELCPVRWCQHNYRELIKSIVGFLLQTLDEANLLDKEALDELLQQQRRENMNEKELMLELNNNIMKLINVMVNK